MSKYNGTVEIERISFELNNLLGQCLTLVDALMPSDSKSKAVKDTIRIHFANFKREMIMDAHGHDSVCTFKD
jgi:hypothetical protein